jgi:hypothetical protein
VRADERWLDGAPRCVQQRSIAMEKHQPPIETLPEIETPVVDIQDLEHKPGPDTRVNNSGISALPKVDLSKEDKTVRQAIEEFEQALKERPPR